MKKRYVNERGNWEEEITRPDGRKEIAEYLGGGLWKWRAGGVGEKVELAVSVDTVKATEQANKLIDLLKSANSLANELADTLKRLELNIEV